MQRLRFGLCVWAGLVGVVGVVSLTPVDANIVVSLLHFFVASFHSLGEIVIVAVKSNGGGR